MKNIQDSKEKKQEEFAVKYFKKNFDELEERDARFCSYVAEARAYAEAIIPAQYNQFTIFDFTGRSSDLKSRLIPSAIASRAKDSICEYCWNMSWKEIQTKGETDSQQRNFLRSHSVMMERLEKGSSVAIFGDSSGGPIGRTMVASIIMSQAIKLRMPVGRKGQTYDWIDFAILKDALVKNGDSITDWKNCDWLVVDNIYYNINSSDQQTAFISEIITPFFIARYSNKLPTILVFQYDLRDACYNVERDLGAGITRILNSKETFKIPLSEKIKL